MTKFRQIRSIAPILRSPKLQAILEDLGEQVLADAQTDPNPDYVDTLRMQVFQSRSRVVVQVGAAPVIGAAVEAKRGTLARALGSIGAAIPSGPELLNYTTKDGRSRKASQAQIDVWTRNRK